MNFIVDKEKKKIKVTREFSAPLNKVWDAWTKSELLDQWWAPKPWKARTKKMEFKEGGYWLYAMVGPESEENWCRADFQSISPMKSFTVSEYFCDSEGTLNTDFPIAVWYCKFNQNGDTTIVDIEIEYETTEDLEKYIEMGFKEGFTMGLENLDELLKKL